MRLIAVAAVLGLACTSPSAHADMADAQRLLSAGDKAGAEQELLRLAEAGDAGAQNQLAAYYLDGRTFPRNVEAARRWAEAAAGQEHAGAQYLFGLLLEQGTGGPKSVYEARRWYERSAAQFFAPAQRAINRMALGELTGRGDYRSAFKMALPLAASGDPDMQTRVADMYRTGKGTEISETEFQRWIDAAIAQNYPPAMLYLGGLYESGIGRMRDANKARDLYRRAVALDFEPARPALARVGGGSELAPAPAAGSAAREQFRFAPPAGFTLVRQAPQATGSANEEYVPEDETAAEWSEKVVLQAAAGVKARDAIALLVPVEQAFRDQKCPFAPSVAPSLIRSEPGLTVASMELVCDEVKAGPGNKKHERLTARAIQGQTGWLIVQRLWHTDGDARAPKTAQWSGFFNAVQLCAAETPAAQCRPFPESGQAVATAEAPRPAQQPAPVPAGSGTGFAINKAGHILTNNHVVAGCREILVKRPGDTVLPAQAVAKDVINDLALLKIAEARYEPATFRRDRAVRAGESVVVFGFPLANGLLSSTGNLTTGTVSSLAGMANDTRMYQITAPIQPGNSGGPLLDAGGYVIGVVSATLNSLVVAARTGGAVPQNANFAIKESVVKTFLDANGVAFNSTAAPRKLDTADVGDLALKFTLQVECRK